MYDYAIKVPVTETEFPGLRAFYTLTAATNNWVPIPEFSSSTPVAGRLTANLALASPWQNRANLYILWVDDNDVTAASDPGWALDNFAVAITAGTFAREPMSVTLTSPATNAAFLAPLAIGVAHVAVARVDLRQAVRGGPVSRVRHRRPVAALAGGRIVTGAAGALLGQIVGAVRLPELDRAVVELELLRRRESAISPSTRPCTRTSSSPEMRPRTSVS